MASRGAVFDPDHRRLLPSFDRIDLAWRPAGSRQKELFMSLVSVFRRSLAFGALAVAFALIPDSQAQDFDPEHPYTVDADGTVSWPVYSGFRRYHAECHVCHGPDGMGSSFAPALVDSLKTLSYDEYAEVVVNGRQNVTTAQENVMPAFGLNPNVMCFLDDIYAYLKARSDGAVGRGRPAKHAGKPDSAREYEDACLGS
jgi:methanol metabolism-related c-type cytochrome